MREVACSTPGLDFYLLSVGKIFAFNFYETMTAGHLLFQYIPLLQSLLTTLTTVMPHIGPLENNFIWSI
jgi:hypothetical protein